MKIGTDITVINRIEKLLEKFETKFIERLLTKEEQTSLTLKPHNIAGYWAAKEAISKALGCGIGTKLSFHDIIIYKDITKAPHFKLSNKIKNIYHINSASLSISHDGGFAIAVVIIDLD